MTKLLKTFTLRVTICSVIALALIAGVVLYGSNFSSTMLSHGPLPPPDDPTVGSGTFVAHGPLPPPDDPTVGSSTFSLAA